MMTMTRRKKIIGLSIASAVLVLSTIAVVLVLNMDWNRAKPWVNTRLSNAIGRNVSIEGNLALTWVAPPVGNTGWQTWLNWPHITAERITIGNPSELNTTPPMAQVERVSFSFSPIPLILTRKLIISDLVAIRPILNLERTADGKNNWTFRQSDTPSPSQIEFQKLSIEDGKLNARDAVKHIKLNASFDTMTEGAGDHRDLQWKIAGTFNGEKMTGSGNAGALMSLQSQTAPYPVAASLQVGKTKLTASGTLSKPRQLAALDMRLHLSGPSLAQLYALTGVVLPETPPYSTEGHLTGTLNSYGGDWTYEKFSGKVGASDIGGTLEYQSRATRPLLKGKVTSNQLHLRDLGPLLGSPPNDNAADDDQLKATTTTPTDDSGIESDKVFPVDRFRTERWQNIDIDVQFAAGKLVRGPKNLPLGDVEAKIGLKDGVLSLLPLNFGIADGNISSNIKLDGRHKAMQSEMKITIRHLKLKQLFPTVKKMQASLGAIDGQVALSATGNSVASILGSANGEAKMLIEHGSISKLLLEELGLNLGNIALIKLTGDKQIKINCMASEFVLKDGLMQARTFVVDTDESIVQVEGDASLKEEQLNLKITPDSKGLRLLSLRAPFYVTGSFKQPKVSVDKGVLALKAGSAVALAALAPAAVGLLPLINKGENEDSPCAKLLLQAKSKLAPPPAIKPIAQSDRSKGTQR
ncbi:MAG: AsmA family protein [Pseudomonadota bacterium]